VDTIINQGPLNIKIEGSNLNVTEKVSEKITEKKGLELGVPNNRKVKTLVNQGHFSTEEIQDSLNIENTVWNRFYYGELIKFAGADFNQFRNYLISKAPWIIFFMMPVFALLLKLIYFRRNFLYIDHLIFGFHLHSFLFLSGIIYLCVSKLSGIEIGNWILLLSMLYILFAFKNFYQQSYKKTIVKIFILEFLYSISALIFFLLSFFVIFIIY
jgi:hypothetical protein